MARDNIGIRMKDFYETVPKTKLMRRTPVAIRIDGKSFHTFTRGLNKPFDDILIDAMQETMLYLCENIQGCVLGYTQSDEITLILCDYQSLEADAWFGYEVQKLCSISASMATLSFNRAFEKRAGEEAGRTASGEYAKALERAVKNGAMFDARCFNIPREEAANLLYWRQLDAIRNSIQMVGQANFTQKELHGKSGNEIQEMLLKKGIEWKSLPIHKQRGSCCVRKEGDEERGWYIDQEIPMFKGDGREYVEKRIQVG